jgi:hypothetical protein
MPPSHILTPVVPLRAPTGTISTATQLASLLERLISARLLPPAAEPAQQLRQQLCGQLQQVQQQAGDGRSHADVTQLQQLLPQGVGFYNSALPKPVRDLVESGMKSGRQTVLTWVVTISFFAVRSPTQNHPQCVCSACEQKQSMMLSYLLAKRGLCASPACRLPSRLLMNHQ